MCKNTFNELQHAGGVNSRTHESCLVAEPVALVIDGRETTLSLADAVVLYYGLGEAIKTVSENNKKLQGEDLTRHLSIIGKTRSGSSFLSSKLGDEKFIFIDGAPDKSMTHLLWE